MRSVIGREYRDYAGDELFQAGIERCLEIVGEALRKAVALDPALAQRISELSKIIGLRHHLAHGYDTIADDIIWDIATTRLPLLRRELEALLAESS